MAEYASFDEGTGGGPPPFGAFSPRTEARLTAVTGQVDALVAEAAKRRAVGSALPAPPADETPKSVVDDALAWLAATKLELQLRPCYVVAEGCTAASALSVLLSFATPWWDLTSVDDVLATRARGGIRLLAVHLCTEQDGGRGDVLNARVCTTVELVDVARRVDYLRVAGGWTWAALTFALPALLAAWAVLRARRKESIDDSWLLTRVPLLRSHQAGAGVCWVGSVLLLIAWASNVHAMSAFDGRVLGAVLGRSGPLEVSPASGLVLVALSWVVLTCAATLVLGYPEEPTSWRDFTLPPLEWPTVHTVDSFGGAHGVATLPTSSGGGVFDGTDTSAAAFFAGGAAEGGGSWGLRSPVKATSSVEDSFSSLLADPTARLLVDAGGDEVEDGGRVGAGAPTTGAEQGVAL